MAGLEIRLRQLEGKFKLQLKTSQEEPQYLDLLEFPQEMVLETFRILKETTGGYRCLFRREQVTAVSQEELNKLDQLTPEQLYNILKPQQATQVNPLQAGEVSES